MTILEALKARRTIRLFKQAAVSSDDLRDMLDAARQTSCACNGQLLRYVVVKSSDDVKKVFEQNAVSLRYPPILKYTGFTLSTD